MANIAWAAGFFRGLVLSAVVVGVAGCGSSGGKSGGSGGPTGTDVDAAAVDVDGDWDTTWGSASAEMTLSQSGNSVTGSYATQIGSIDPTYDYGSLTGTL